MSVSGTPICNGFRKFWINHREIASFEAVSLEAAMGLERRLNEVTKELEQYKKEMHWLDHHCAFVADYEYKLGPFKIGELRLLAQAGIKADESNPTQA